MQPFVPSNQNMKEFTFKAVAFGLLMCVVLGAANAYLGLKAGMTIAATYPAAVIGMALIKLFKGTILRRTSRGPWAASAKAWRRAPSSPSRPS